MSDTQAIGVSDRPARTVRADWARISSRIEPTTAGALALMLVAAVVLLYVGRRLTFFYDEWTFILTRRQGGLGTFLDPHNGHLVVFAAIVYKVLFALVGLRHYWPYRAVGVAEHLLCGWFLFVLLRRRVGPLVALVPLTLLLFMGTAWQVLLWPFQITFLTSVAGGLGALALLDRRSPRRDAGAAAMLIWSLSGSATGLSFLVAAAIVLIVRRASLRSFWIVLVPAVLYGIWYLGWGTSEQITTNSVLTSPEYVADAAAGAMAGIAGLAGTWGPPLTVGALAALAARWTRRGGGPPTAMLLAAAGGVLSFWVLAALVRSQAPDPTASRYLYVGAVFIWLIAGEMVGFGFVVRGWWLAVAAVVALGILVSQIGALRGGEGGLRASDNAVRTSFGVVQLSVPAVSPAFIPEPINAPQLNAGEYLAAVRALGSPALTLPELEAAPEYTREGADLTFEHGEQIAAVRASTPPAGTSCQSYTPSSAAPAADFTVSPGGALFVSTTARQHVEIYLRRLGGSFQVTPFETFAGPGGVVIRFPADHAPALTWKIAVTGPQPMTTCVS